MKPPTIKSPGNIAKETGIPYQNLQRIIDEQRIAPWVTINGVAHYDEQAVQKILAAHLIAQKTR